MINLIEHYETNNEEDCRLASRKFDTSLVKGVCFYVASMMGLFYIIVGGD